AYGWERAATFAQSLAVSHPALILCWAEARYAAFLEQKRRNETLALIKIAFATGKDEAVWRARHLESMKALGGLEEAANLAQQNSERTDATASDWLSYAYLADAAGRHAEVKRAVDAAATLAPEDEHVTGAHQALIVAHLPERLRALGYQQKWVHEEEVIIG